MQSEDFHYDDDTHIYWDGTGRKRPSMTGVLKEAGIVDYSMVDPALLEEKRLLGQEVHAWTAEHDRDGHNDLTTLSTKAVPYAKAWLKFKQDFHPTFVEIEQPRMAKIGGPSGILLGGTPDAIVMINRRLWILDKKCCTTTQPSWELQVAGYEMQYTKKSYIGILGRMSVRLAPNARYYPMMYEDERAAVVMTEAARLVENPSDLRAKKIVDAWKYNKGILARAS